MNHTLKQTEALWASAEHWLENWQSAAGDRSKTWSVGAEDCACCQRYYDSSPYPCLGCPIYKYTGKKACYGTPYEITRKAALFSVELEYRFLVCLALGEDPRDDPVLSTSFY